MRLACASLLLSSALVACPQGRIAASPVGKPGATQSAEALLLQPTGLVPGQRPEPPPLGGVRVAVFGDFGTGTPEELEVAKLVLGWAPDAVVTTGDNATPDPGDGRLDRFVGAVYGALPGAARGGAPAQARVFWPVAGNHDWRAPDAIQTYLDYFKLPGNGRYYDNPIAGGKVHLFAVDSDSREPDGIGADSKQAQWLKERLAASAACLKLVAFHHPPYSSSRHGSKAELRWPYRAWGADAVLSGHDHVFERLEIDGIPYIVTGLGGREAYEFHSPLPETRRRWNQRHGALLVTVGPEATVYEFWTWAGERVDRLEVARRCR